VHFLIELSLGVYVAGLACLLFSYFLEVARWMLHRRDRQSAAPAADSEPLRSVTVQIPVANEFYVVERVIDACCRLDYSSDRLDVQVLDDSTDGTSALIDARVSAHKARGVNITHLRRKSSTGYKAGNLQHGLASARGEFVAVFDADFVPDPDFLLETMQYFGDADVGIVQAGVRHANRTRSLLTRAQDPFGQPPAASSDAGAGRYVNLFGGSAGVGRTTCLTGAGGWQTDTLTEDEDLSIRAYLHGWRCVKVNKTLASDDLVERIADFKNRVARCNQGPVECCRKHLGDVVRHARLAPLQKLSALSALFCPWLSVPSIALMAAASVPLALDPAVVPDGWRVIYMLPGSGVLVVAAAVSLSRSRAALAATVLLYVGTSFRGLWAVLLGLAGRRAPFNRTTKPGGRPSTPLYPVRASAATWVEGGLAVFLAAGLASAIRAHAFWFVPLHLLCCASCLFVCGLSAAEVQTER
jgi:cellulose synthase/poly-beta-1,6-N-acetylglucosamine synthase-like glycosyltransferase